MRETVKRVESALSDLGKPSPWGPDLKVSDEFLTPLFKAYFKKLGIYNTMPKKEFFRLVEYVPEAEIVDEIRAKLDVIARIAALSGD